MALDLVKERGPYGAPVIEGESVIECGSDGKKLQATWRYPVKLILSFSASRIESVQGTKGSPGLT